MALEAFKIAAIESEIEVAPMNLLEATRLLVLTWSEEICKKIDIKEYLPIRRRIPGKKVGRLGLTTENSYKAAPNDESQWIWPSK